MADSDNTRPTTNPRCYKCWGTTSFYTRILDPKTSKTHELYDCSVCDVLTSRVLDKE